MLIIVLEKSQEFSLNQGTPMAQYDPLWLLCGPLFAPYGALRPAMCPARTPFTHHIASMVPYCRIWSRVAPIMALYGPLWPPLGHLRHPVGP